ncbi:Arabinose efflux permease family protein [Frankia sp. AiPs1]|uniref:MFS transporter n=1 Tax=Frankia sp. AiPa1 TaxID=573492 RepID=UPI00202ACD23|nr:MFS transporter [Frankia sp. AiPa1]MCL9762088.1 MFS transporter [Frankia sp. AiPa1]
MPAPRATRTSPTPPASPPAAAGAAAPTRTPPATTVSSTAIPAGRTPEPEPARPATVSRQPGRLAGRLGPGASFVLQASMLTSFLASSAAPTPIYALYQHAWGFSPITLTVVFGVYALAVLAALLVVGGLSDHLGRRPVLLAACTVQAAAMVVFLRADSVGGLLAARTGQGLATGAAIGALGAGLLDLHHARGTLLNAAGSFAGIAFGAFGSALCVAFLPSPTRLVYLILLAVVIAQAAGVLVMRETSTRVPGALASLRPHLDIPAPVRRVLPAAGPCLVATWALSGFYFSLGPGLARLVADTPDATGHQAVVLGGLAVLSLAGTAAAVVVAARGVPASTMMLIGLVMLIVGVTLTLLAVVVAAGAQALLFTGSVLAGAGIGAGVQGSLRVVLPLAAAHQRAGVLATLYVLCYLALGVPAVAAGWRVTHTGLEQTSREYGLAVIALAVIALLALLRLRRPRTPPTRGGAHRPNHPTALRLKA